MSEVLSAQRAQQELAYTPELFGVAKKKGFRRPDTLSDALESVREQRGVGKYEGREIHHLEDLRPFAVPAVIEALRVLSSPDTKLSDLDTFAVLAGQLEQLEMPSVEMLDEERKAADEFFEDVMAQEEIAAGQLYADTIAQIEAEDAQPEETVDTVFAEEEEPVEQVDDSTVVLVERIVPATEGSQEKLVLNGVEISGVHLLEDSVTRRTTIELDFVPPAELANEPNIRVTTSFKYHKRSGQYGSDGTSQTAYRSLNGDRTVHISTNTYFDHQKPYELVLRLSANGGKSVEVVVPSEKIPVTQVQKAA